jgi:hypothetical protein
MIFGDEEEGEKKALAKNPVFSSMLSHVRFGEKSWFPPASLSVGKDYQHHR